MVPKKLDDLRLAPVRRWRVPYVIEAAVAVVLRDGPSEPELLLVKRAVRAGDPWSGDMALPGGRRGTGDVDLLATAIREAHEEVGLVLTRAACRGALTPVVTLARRHARLTPMVVTPIVFVVHGEPALHLNHELAAARWVPLAAFSQRAEKTSRPWRVLGFQLSAPAWQLGDDVVWGLTHQMLTRLVRALRAGHRSR